MKSDDTHQLTFYVAGKTIANRRMIRELRRYCRQRTDTIMKLKAIDVLERPKAAEAARVLATPTLVCDSARGSRRVIGDPFNRDRLLNELIIPPAPTTCSAQSASPKADHSRPRVFQTPHSRARLEPEASARLIEKSTDAILIVDRAGFVQFANPAAEALLGRRGPRLIGREFGFPLVVEKSMELAILRPDGSAVVVDVRTTAMKWSGMDVYAAFLRDITVRKQTEAALHTSQERLRSMVEAIPDYAISVLDNHGRISEWNAGAARLFGYEGEEILGRDFACFHTAEDQTSRKAERLLAGARNASRVEDEGWRVRRDGSRFWANVVIAVLRDGEGGIAGFCKITRDMTARHDLERRHLELEKLELGRQLAAGVAHRFNNLMCGVMIGAELLHMKAREDSEICELAGIMKNSATHAARVTNQLLTFSQNLGTEPRRLDLTDTLRQLAPSLQKVINGSVNLKWNIGTEALFTRVDPAQLEVLLLNLASNADDAMPDGGEFAVELGQFELDESHKAHYPELSPGSYLMLTVSDTGCGMTDDVLAHAGEPFYTTKDPRRDGLGLAVCQGIVKLNGGGLHVRSQPGRGTRVEVLLPCAETAGVTGRQSPTTPPGGTETILLVDDEDSLRQMTADSLRDLGYRVLEAASGELALDILRSGEPPPIAALVTDGRMPGMGGRTLAREMHALQPDARILFISGYPAIAGETNILPEFGTAALAKPFTVSALASRLRELLDS